MNIVVLQGVVSRPVEMRELAGGTTLAMLDVATETAGGRLVVPVAWESPGSVPQAGSEIVVTGHVRRRFFRARGATQPVDDASVLDGNRGGKRPAKLHENERRLAQRSTPLARGRNRPRRRWMRR